MNPKKYKTITEYNHKRVETLFDGVIAIAMTMMALEISPPDFPTFDAQALTSILSELTVYLISFIVLASIWGIHAILYSSFTGLGSLGYILINIVLMFLVTVFPIFTNLMWEFKSSVMLRCMYIGCYLLMEIIMVFLLFSANKQNINEQKMLLAEIKNSLELYKEFQQEPSKDIDAIQKKLAMAEQYSFDKETSQKLFQELLLSLPKQLQEQFHQKELLRNTNFFKSIYFLIILFVVIASSVAVLMINPFLCYLIIAIGIIFCVVGNFIIVAYCNNKNAEK